MEEFDLLSNLVARKLSISLKALPGVRVVQRNGYLPCGDGAWSLPDLPYQGEAWALFRLEGQAADLAPWIAGGQVALAQVLISWQNSAGLDESLSAQRFALPLIPSTEYSGLTEDPLVARRAGELDAADLQEQAHQAALRGDWDRVQVLLDELKVLAQDNPWTKSVVEELESLIEEGSREILTKELRFSSSMGSMRLTEKDEAPDHLSSSASYLRRKPRQGKPRKPDADPKS